MSLDYHVYFYYALNNRKLVLYLWSAGAVAALLLKKISNDLSSSAITLMVLYVYKISKNLLSPEDLNEMSFRVGRIAAWLAPEKYAKNQSFQSLQALYAIGSGGWFGKRTWKFNSKIGCNTRGSK